MRDHHRTTRPARRVESFIERFEQPLALVSHVGGIDALESGQLSGQRFDFRRRGRFVGRIEKPGSKSSRSCGKTLAKERAHLTDLAVRRWPVQLLHCSAAQRRMPDQGQRVDGCRMAIKLGCIRLECGKECIVCIIREHQVQRRRWWLITDPGRQADTTVADHHSGHPLTQLGRDFRVGQQQSIVMGVHIDEPWRDHLAARIDHCISLCYAEIADRGNTIALQCYIGCSGGTPGPVDNLAACDQQIAAIQPLCHGSSVAGHVICHNSLSREIQSSGAVSARYRFPSASPATPCAPKRTGRQRPIRVPSGDSIESLGI